MMRNWKGYEKVLLAVLPIVTLSVTIALYRNPRDLEVVRGGWSRRENAPCITCHRGVIESVVEKDSRIVNFHRLHLESEKTEYAGRQHLCVTCHAGFYEADSANAEPTPFVRGGVLHPEVADRRMKKIVRRSAPGAVLFANMSFNNDRPYPFKPTLDTMVCIECHGIDSKTGVIFYGDGADRWRTRKETTK